MIQELFTLPSTRQISCANQELTSNKHAYSIGTSTESPRLPPKCNSTLKIHSKQRKMLEFRPKRQQFYLEQKQRTRRSHTVDYSQTTGRSYSPQMLKLYNPQLLEQFSRKAKYARSRYETLCTEEILRPDIQKLPVVINNADSLINSTYCIKYFGVNNDQIGILSRRVPLKAPPIRDKNGNIRSESPENTERHNENKIMESDYYTYGIQKKKPDNDSKLQTLPNYTISNLDIKSSDFIRTHLGVQTSPNSSRYVHVNYKGKDLRIKKNHHFTQDMRASTSYSLNTPDRLHKSFNDKKAQIDNLAKSTNNNNNNTSHNEGQTTLHEAIANPQSTNRSKDRKLLNKSLEKIPLIDNFQLNNAIENHALSSNQNDKGSSLKNNDNNIDDHDDGLPKPQKYDQYVVNQYLMPKSLVALKKDKNSKLKPKKPHILQNINYKQKLSETNTKNYLRKVDEIKKIRRQMIRNIHIDKFKFSLNSYDNAKQNNNNNSINNNNQLINEEKFSYAKLLNNLYREDIPKTDLLENNQVMYNIVSNKNYQSDYLRQDEHLRSIQSTDKYIEKTKDIKIIQPSKTVAGSNELFGYYQRVKEKAIKSIDTGIPDTWR